MAFINDKVSQNERHMERVAAVEGAFVATEKLPSSDAIENW